MAPTPPTILSLKHNFLTTQTRLLSAPLGPSRSFISSSPEEEERLPPRAVDDALLKLNHLLTQHSRRVYAAQATRHVAEQIDQLYWDHALAVVKNNQESDNDDDDDDDGDAGRYQDQTDTAGREAGLVTGVSIRGEGGRKGIIIGTDLTDSSVIKSLPTSWERVSKRQAEAHPAEAQRYAELVMRVQELGARRDEVAGRVARLRRMRGLLEPFEEVDGVQENLVTRNGEVETELQRMRMLLARVGGRVSQLREQERPDKERDQDVMDVDGLEQKKVGELLERF